MTEFPTRRRRKLAAQRLLACMVSSGAAGSVTLTLYSGRRTLTRELTAQEAQVLAHLLTHTAPQQSDRPSKRLCGSSLHQPSSSAGCDTYA